MDTPGDDMSKTRLTCGARGRAGIAALAALTVGVHCGVSIASAQDLGTDPPINGNPGNISPKIVPGNAPKPAVASGFNGPLATFAAPLADKGITFHAIALNFSEVNPSLGLVRGRGANSLYVIEGADADLGKLLGLSGLSLHYENVFFPATENLNIAAQIGDSQVGYQPPFTPRIARLSRATVEQKTLGDHLDIEIGATHPAYYYALFNCDSINSCFQDLLYLNAGYTSYKFSVPGANFAYQVTPTVYAQAGVFANQQNANDHVGYDFGSEKYNGVLGMGEIGSKTTFATNPYPYSVSVTGFFTTQDHVDYNAATAYNGVTRISNGTSGIVVQADKVVWRRDGGADPTNVSPTALKFYTSIGTAIDSTTPIQSDIWVGATLLSPFVGRPADRFGLKFNWERLNPSYTQYLTAANAVSGGPGGASPYQRDKFVFEANAHIQLPLGMAFEPVVQYAVNPNSFFNPLTPVKAHDGVYLGGTYVIPIGVILGFAAAT